MRSNYQQIPPRQEWPDGTKIPVERQPQPGYALSLYNDRTWGKNVAQSKYNRRKFGDDLVGACVEMLQKKGFPDPPAQWVTCVPSLKQPNLVPDFAERLAIKLGIPFIQCVEKIRANNQQKNMSNDQEKVENLKDVFRITDQFRNEACLLIDDVVDSRWTFAVVADLLRQAGCAAVHPMALAARRKIS